MDTINVLKSMKLPERRITDLFGANRDWAPPGEVDPDSHRAGWYPGTGYRPIHYGVDYGYDDDKQVRAPGDGLVGYDASNQMIVYVPTIHSKEVPDCLVYLRHVVAGDVFADDGWHWVSQGSVIGTPDTVYTAFPHLHFEVVISVQLYLNLVSAEVLKCSPGEFTVSMMGDRGSAHGLDRYHVIAECNQQIATDDFRLVQEHEIFRFQLPEYKRTEYGFIGRDMICIVDPFSVVGV